MINAAAHPGTGQRQLVSSAEGELEVVIGHLRLTTGSVTALIGRLVAAELVTRTVDPVDRRVVWIELRPETWQKLAGVYGPAGREVSEYSASISVTRRNHSVKTLHHVADRLEQLLADQ